MTISTMAQLAAVMPGQQIPLIKSPISANSTVGLTSGWTWTGPGSVALPAAGSTPPSGSGEAPTSATTGAIQFTNAAAGASLYIARLVWNTPSNTSGGMDSTGYVLYDRCVHTSGLSLNTTTPQTVNSVTVPSARDPTGAGGILWLECYSAGGGTAATITASYTNQSGVSGQTATSPSFTSSTFGGLAMMVMNLQTGDTGVRSVESVTVNALTGGAGNFGVTIGRPLLEWETAHPPLGPRALDWNNTGLPFVPNNACLAFAAFSPGTGATRGTLYLVEA